MSTTAHEQIKQALAAALSDREQAAAQIEQAIESGDSIQIRVALRAVVGVCGVEHALQVFGECRARHIQKRLETIQKGSVTNER